MEKLKGIVQYHLLIYDNTSFVRSTFTLTTTTSHPIPFRSSSLLSLAEVNSCQKENICQLIEITHTPMNTHHCRVSYSVPLRSENEREIVLKICGASKLSSVRCLYNQNRHSSSTVIWIYRQISHRYVYTTMWMLCVMCGGVCVRACVVEGIFTFNILHITITIKIKT